MQLVKRLLGEGRQVRIWDDNVSLGRLIGSNRQYIEEVIPHIGSLLSTDFADVVANAEVVVIATRGLDEAQLRKNLESGAHGDRSGESGAQAAARDFRRI